MIDLTIIAEFLIEYSYVFLSAAFVLTVLFAFINIFYNPYRRQNKMFAKCKTALAETCSGKSMSRFTEQLDETYGRQWRMWSKTSGMKPSSVFEFVPVKKRARCQTLFIAAAVLTGMYFFVFIFDVTRLDFLLWQGVFGLAAAWIFCMKGLTGDIFQRKARRQFGSFLACLDSYCGSSGKEFVPPVKQQAVENAVQQINTLKKGEKVDMSAIAKASEILRSKGLEGSRTVDEQRKLNNALNGLLQAYARQASQKDLPY